MPYLCMLCLFIYLRSIYSFVAHRHFSCRLVEMFCSTRVAEHPHPSEEVFWNHLHHKAAWSQSQTEWVLLNFLVSLHHFTQKTSNQKGLDSYHTTAYSHFNYLLSIFQKINVLFKHHDEPSRHRSCPYRLGARRAYRQRTVLRRWHLNWEWKDASSSQFWNRWGEDILGRGSHMYKGLRRDQIKPSVAKDETKQTVNCWCSINFGKQCILI